MVARTRHISISIERAPGEVYDFAVEPVNLPRWASGLSSGISEADGRWVADSPMGEVEVQFSPRNDLGVLDHTVTLPTSEVFSNPMRVFANESGSEVVFTLLRMPGVSDDDFDRDAATIAADLQALKDLLEE